MWLILAMGTEVASGMRLGTPAITSRGFGANEARRVAELILRTLKNPGDDAVKREVKNEVLSFAERFPVPGIDR